jgi:oligosaccharide repeat unit polymerase
MLASRNRRSVAFFKFALVIGFLNAALLAVTQSERLALYEFVVPVVVTVVGARIATRETIPRRRVATLAAVLIIVVAGSWFVSEYGRTYLSRYGDATSAPSSAQVASDQLLAYVVTNVNNGLYTVDHARQFSFPLYTLNGFLTPFGFDSPATPFLGPASSEASRLLDEIYPTSPFTTFSLPGYAFLELGWGGIVLMCWLGAFVGLTYSRLRAGEVWAVLVYPLVVVGLLDSFRIFYWTESRAMIAAGFILVVVAMMPHTIQRPRGLFPAPLKNTGHRQSTGAVSGSAVPASGATRHKA